VQGALPGRADALVGVGGPLCEVFSGLADPLPPVAAATVERRGWPFPCRIVIDGPRVSEITITSTCLIDDRPTYGVAVATSGGAFAAVVEIDVQTGSAVVELGHRDARWAMPLAEDELAAVVALGEAV
jgi:hypothetical protein